MNYCSACGKEIGEGSGFCQHCGAKVGQQTTSNVTRDTATITDSEYAAFIGKNSDKYLTKFKKFSVLGKDNFTATWHWPAFFFGPFWMFYRKLYLWAVGALVVEFIPWVNLLFWIGWGIVGYYLYYKHTKNKIQEFKGTAPPENVAPVLVQVGGVHHWLLKAYVALILICGVGGMIAAIGIPAYTGYKKRAAEVEGMKAEQQANANKTVKVSSPDTASQGRLEPVGAYHYKEQGFSGKMVITEISSTPLTWKASIGTGSNDGHTCDVEATGHNLIGTNQEIEAAFESKAEGGDSPTKFTVKFTPNMAIIAVQDVGGACGMRGSFEGRWGK
ncbi:MAG TPA: DUF2628 domain-containing protein [Syntrophorhabdus sp.]|jgi:Tfp pilus assembly major pilin PilA|nr:DUF2628 domain-containing protein [Syntrophorhabdus sp.]